MGKENLTQLLSQLNVQSTQEDSCEVEKICKELLKNGCENPGFILRACLVAVIKQDRYKSSLEILKQNKDIDDKYGEEFILEKLYVFYKLDATHEFEALYSKINPPPLESFGKANNRGILHVRAQFCYKQGLYEEAFKIYNLLAKHNGDLIDNDLELACNERVPLTAMPDIINDSTILSQVNEESYDLLLNDSMILSARGKYDEAIELLEQAYKIAKREGYDRDQEAIGLQLAFVLQMKGDNKASHIHLQELVSLLKQGGRKSPFTLLARMNEKSFADLSKYNDNLNLSIRELDFKTLDSMKSKQFTREQWTVINRNRLILHLFNNNSVQYGSSLLSRSLHNYSNLVNDVIFESYKTQAKKLYHHAVQMINSGVNGSVIGFLIITVQLLVVEKQWQNAIAVCELYLNKLANSTSQVDTVEHHAVCYILFELYKITGRDHSKSVLLKNLTNGKKTISKDVPFWKHVGFQHLSLGNIKDAKKLFKQVFAYDSDKALEKVIFDTTLDVDESQDITQNIDVEKLLLQGIKCLETSNKLESKQHISKVQKKRINLKKQKKKEQRLKKFLQTHGSTKNVDPERWLPLKDRSSYRPKKKQSLTKQTQGGAMNKKAEQALDITNKLKKTIPTTRRKKGHK